MWGEFELLGILGTGAFAKVYLARQHGLAGRLVALKLTFRQTHESQWLATLQHSAIVPIYSTHSSGQVYGICMPFLGNTTLADLLRETPRSATISSNSWWSRSRRKGHHGGSSLLSTIQQRHEQIDTIVNTVAPQFRITTSEDSISQVDEGIPASLGISNPSANSLAAQSLNQCDYVRAICWIGSQLADALSYAHRNGIVHSDIKPANVLLAFDGQPRLLDFNVAYKSSSDGTVSKDLSLGGTIPYMSPEHRQAFHQSAVVDARSDIYSLGVVLFELLTGRLPDEKSVRQTNPSLLNSSVSPATSAIIRKCLETEPSARYQSADALRDDLTAQYHHATLVHQPEPSLLESLSKWSYRHPRLSSSISVVSLSSLLVVFLILGVVVRQVALDRADWVHRIDLLRQRIPNSMAMLTSLEAVPELEAEVLADLQKSFGLVEARNAVPNEADHRWVLQDGIVDNALRSELQQLAWLTTQYSWLKSPILPNGILDVSGTNPEPKPDESNRRPLILIQERKFGDAIPLLKRRTAENPRDYVGWWLLGDCCQAIQDFENAQQSYTVCIALQPTTAIAYFNRGMARFSALHFELAADDYEQACSLAPTWHWSRLNRALSLQRLGRLEEAISELDKAIEKGYATVSVYRLRGELQAALGDADGAKLDFSSALQCEPKTDQHWIDRGLIQLSSNPRKAVEDFENALKASPNSIDAHQKLAYVYSELLQQPDKSLDHSNRLIELAPWQPTHLAGRAVSHARSKRTQEALNDLRLLETMRLQEPILMYQVACGYSLLAGNASLEQDLLDFSKSAFRWYTMAVGTDPSIVAIAMTDPDVQWMREQVRFQDIANAIQTLKLSPP